MRLVCQLAQLSGLCNTLSQRGQLVFRKELLIVPELTFAKSVVVHFHHSELSHAAKADKIKVGSDLFFVLTDFRVSEDDVGIPLGRFTDAECSFRPNALDTFDVVGSVT